MTTEATLGAETIRQSKYRDDHRVDRRAAVHALLLPLCRPGGRAGPGLEHAHARGLDDPGQGPLHVAGAGRPGPDRGHGRWTTTC